MNRILLILLLLPVFCNAQNLAPGIPVISSDSFKKYVILYYSLDSSWKFHEGDDTAMANPNYDDSKWINVSPSFRMNDKRTYNPFSSIGWFRFHFIADTSVTGKALAISMGHYGASDIYFDGKKIKSFGHIDGRANSKYMDPNEVPFTFVIPNAGAHVIAIRYANYDAQKNFEQYEISFTGFTFSIGTADNVFNNFLVNLETNSFFPVLIFSIFITLFVLHLLLFLFYRSAKSNLYFSIFCLSLSFIFLLFYINKTTDSVGFAKMNFYAMYATFSVLNLSLSGFSNELFGSKKLRFKILIALCIMTFAIGIFSPAIAFLSNFILLCFILFEAIILTVRGIWKKVRGARIIGTGILFFALFLITIFVIGAMQGGSLAFKDDDWRETLFLYTSFCAILSIPASMSIYLSWNVATMNKEISSRLRQVELLSAQTIAQEQEKKHILESQNELLEKEVASRTAEIVTEKNKSDELLLNILPAEVADELKEKGSSKARFFDEVTVLFTDFVDFTEAGERMEPEELVNELHTCFKAFDEIVSKHGIEKIKTIGDAYLAVCGLPETTTNHASKVAAAALEIIAFMTERRARLGAKTFEVRIGIHSGSVVAGIVGVKKFAYDIWGDTVNTAARLEQSSIPGKINISQTTYDLLQGKFACTYRGKIQAKNKGELSMYFIDKPI